MLRKISTLFVVLVMLAFSLNAQNKAILRPTGEMIPVKGQNTNEIIKDLKIKNLSNVETRSIIAKPVNSKGTIDTMSYRETGANMNTNFGFFSQDLMVQWFVAPADLIIKAVGVMPSDVSGAAAGVGVSIVGTGLTLDDFSSSGQKLWGRYPSADGFMGSTPFEWTANGEWESFNEMPAPFTEDLWSDFGDGFPITITHDATYTEYNWVVLQDALGFEPRTILRNEVFAIVTKHNGTDIAQPGEERMGFISTGGLSPAINGFKYYAVKRLADGDQGWWTRNYVWDFVAQVDLIGDRPPVISDVTALNTTLSTEAQLVEATIVDDNPSGGTAGVASAILYYTTNGGTDWSEVPMSNVGDLFSASIPGQVAGTEIYYYVFAFDVNANSSESSLYWYKIFLAEENTLVVYNGLGAVSGYPSSYYFGDGTLGLKYDRWAYGQLTAELLGNYTNVLEIATKGPADDNQPAIAEWIAGSGSRNYMLAGDEYFGFYSGWVNQAHVAGDFIFDVLGVNYEYNDVNYAASGDQTKASNMAAVEGTLLGGPLYTEFTTINNGDMLVYDPYYEIGASNWLDGADFEADVQVDMKGFGIDGTEYNAGGHRTLPAGNKVAFFTFDPLSLDAKSDTTYEWYGFYDVAPQIQTALWFGVESGVEPINNQIPSEFAISQNYPNPFNPSTKINFALTVDSRVEITIYNLLGQVVANEVYGNITSGLHEYTFNGSNLSSGVYFYNVKVEGVDGSNYSNTKKMMLLK